MIAVTWLACGMGFFFFFLWRRGFSEGVFTYT